MERPQEGAERRDDNYDRDSDDEEEEEEDAVQEKSGFATVQRSTGVQKLL